MPAEEIGRRARRPGCQVDPCYLWSIANFFLLGRKIMAMVDPQARRPRGHRRRCSTSGSGPRSPTGATAPARRGTRARRTPYDDATVAALLDGVAPIDDDEHRTAGEAVQRHARQPPLPALLRHPGRLRRHRARTRCPGSPAARCSCATSTGWPRATSPGRRSPRTCRTTTSPRRSCSTTCSARSPTSARRTTRPRTTSTASSAFGLYTTDGLPPGRAPAGAGRRARRHRGRGAQGAGPALPQHRRHGPGREDPGRRLRVLHASSAPSPRSPASPTSSTGPCPATCPSRSTSSCRRCRARTPASPRTRPTTSSTRRMPP